MKRITRIVALAAIVVGIPAGSFGVMLTSCQHPMPAVERPRALPTQVVVCSELSKVLPPALASVNGGTQPDAVTAGGVTFYFADHGDPGLRCHEAKHREQQAAEGAMFYPRYTLEHVKHGYFGNRYENEARAEQAKCDMDPSLAPPAPGGGAR
jgi:hypothetical protein